MPAARPSRRSPAITTSRSARFPPLDATGNDADGNAIADLPAGQALVTAVFESDVGLENNPIPADQGYVWYAVTAVSAARDRELSEVREKVIAAWKAAEVEKRLTTRAEEIRDQVESGGDLATIATVPRSPSRPPPP